MPRQNGISVEDMLKLDIMKDCSLIAGFKGARNTISIVNIMADPDIMDWVQAGEFLLTTAYFFDKDNLEAQKELIRNCASKNLAGLGIKVKPYLDSLPQELIDLANQLNFPLINIHQSIPLSDVMLPVFKEIFEKQAFLLEKIEKVHEEFMSIMLGGKGIEEITGVVHKNVDNPAVLSLKYSNQIIEKFGDVNSSTKERLLKDVKDFYSPNDGRSKLKRLDEDRVLVNGRFVRRMIMPIILKDDVYGHIFTWSTNTPIGGFDLSIIESASTTIALAVLQELSVKEVEIRYRSEFFEDLISTDSKRKKKALERTHFFNLKPNNYYVIEVMSFKLKFEGEKPDDYVFEYLQDYSNMIVSTVEEVMDYLNLDGIVSTKLNGIQILLSFEDLDSVDQKLEIFNEKLVGTLSRKFEDIDINVGVGRAYKGLENVNKSFADAVKTIRIAKIITKKDVVTFDELGIFKILSQDFLTEELEDFYKTTLKPLVDYDEKKSTEFVKTLEAYFTYNGNLTRMSEHLFTHYNTILYRINRINEITNMDLNDPNNRLNLEIALKIRKLL